MKKLKSCLLQITRNRFFKEILGALIGFLVFIIMAVIVKTQSGIPSLDVAVRDFAYNVRGEKGGFLYWFFRIVTEFGFVYVIIFIFCVFAVFTRIDLRCAVLGFGSIINYLANEVVKQIYQRERPIESMRWMFEASTSFPSGHSMTSMYFYSLLAYFTYRSWRASKKQKILVVCLAYLAVFLVGLSRIMLGVHYFTDVLGGFGLGFALSMISIIIFKVLNDKGYKFLSKYIIKEPKLK